MNALEQNNKAGKSTGDKEFVREITPKSVDFSQWYIDVILKAQLMDYAPIKGFMAFRPAGFALWEKGAGAA
jgi:prolyl-tRNA synthetase